MTEQATDRWLLPILATIRIRPGAFLGDERVETLSTFLLAYEMGRCDVGFVGMAPEDKAVLAAFEGWLVDRTKEHGEQGTAGWPSLVKRIDNSERSVVTFFALFEEFLQGRGDSLDKVQQWTSSFWQVPPSSS